MGVAVKELPMNKDGKPVEDEPGKPVVRRRALVAAKDFSAGDVIYNEHPMIAALDLDLEGKGTHCSNCLRELSPMLSIPVPNDPMGITYCSKACQLASSASWHNLLFGDKPISLEAAGAAAQLVSPAEEAEQQKKRRQAQEAFVAHMKSIGKVTPLITARFLGRMISGELAKVLPSETTPPPPSNLPEPDDGATNAFYDHIDRLRYLEVVADKDDELELTLLKDMLNGAMAGLDEFISGDRYVVLKGKVLFNAIGIAYSGGRLNKPKSGERFESWDLTRTPYGTSRQTGAGFYRVSSYLAHSCAPSARPSFPKGTSELHLVANRDIKAGEELTMSYVRSTPTEGESPLENRKTRRQELARGWRFACECIKCAEELVAIEKEQEQTKTELKESEKEPEHVEVKAAEEVQPVEVAAAPETPIAAVPDVAEVEVEKEKDEDEIEEADDIEIVETPTVTA